MSCEVDSFSCIRDSLTKGDKLYFTYSDFRDNGQYISVGNLKENDRAALFLMDYANQRRLKIYAHVEVSETKDAPELIEKLKAPECKAQIKRAFVLHVEAFDWNCPQHITPRYMQEEVTSAVQPLLNRIEELEAEIARWRKEASLNHI